MERKFYARLDMHIWGEDCPYICEKYEQWKKENHETDPDPSSDLSDADRGNT